MKGSSGRVALSARVDAGVLAADALTEDEALLRAGGPAARVGVLADTSISVGVGGNSGGAWFERARDHGLEPLRRRTGGSAVLHAPGDLVWSIVLPRGDPRVGPGFVHAYARLGAPVARALGEFGIEARWGAPLALSEEYCALSARGSVLLRGDRVVGGAAQHVSARALLHHGFLARRVEPEPLRAIFGLSPESIGRLTGWTETRPDLASETLAAGIARSLAAGIEPSYG